MSTQTLLMIEKKEESGLAVYTVHGADTSPYNFLKEEDAFSYAKTILNGKGSEVVPRRQGGIRTNAQVAARKREWLLETLKEPKTVRDVCRLARSSRDKVISNVPYGTWSGIISLLYHSRKLVVTQTIQTATGRDSYMYKVAKPVATSE